VTTNPVVLRSQKFLRSGRTFEISYKNNTTLKTKGFNPALLCLTFLAPTRYDRDIFSKRILRNGNKLEICFRPEPHLDKYLALESLLG
jgi:hypothetical protein